MTRDDAPAFYLGTFRCDPKRCDAPRCSRLTTLRLAFVQRGDLFTLYLCPRCLQTAAPLLLRSSATWRGSLPRGLTGPHSRGYPETRATR